MTISRLLILIFGWLIAACVFAQDEQHSASPSPTPIPSQSTEKAPTSTSDESMKGMSHGDRDSGRNLFQSDMSLMTGMVPRDPMAGMTMPGWHLMDLSVARLSYNRQGGPSGGSGIESSNWNMIHAQHDLGPGRLSLMMMNSLEPATFAKLGSRELFQTGESYGGRPLVDRQHPHDFFMNLSATYRLDLGADSGAWLQLAPVGEPALGPTAFMHRASAGENPTAPLGHHWQDSTHIAFNVVTIGGGWKWVALEGSVFHGQEPDEHRWDIEGGSIDSASGRVRFLLGGGWSGQISYGFLKNPERLEPGDTHRTTAAVSYGAEGDRPFAAMVVWGRNDEPQAGSDSFLLEAAYQITTRDQIYGRAELVQKDSTLLLTKEISGGAHVGSADLVRVGAYTAGYLRDFDLVSGLKTGIGADLTIYSFPSSLDPVYGHSPVSIHAFLRLRWGNPHGAAGHMDLGRIEM